MGKPYFQFKQFTVWHDKCAQKVGTDGVLLGAWTDAEKALRILDVGTGTGLVAIMLAQRSRASITALEIDEEAFVQATENIKRSPWPSRIEAVCADFNHYKPAQQFDLIVCNPPYFIDSLKSSNAQRNTARHCDNLSYADLLQGVNSMLAPHGTFTLVIPTDVAQFVIDTAATQQLYPNRQLLVKTKPGAAAKRTLITFGRIKQACKTEELLTELSRHVYSKAYKDLTKAYYLNL